MVRAAALSAALFLAGGAIPVAGSIAMLFAPAPILIFAVGRLHPLIRTMISIWLAAGLVLVAAGPVAGVGYLATFGLATGMMAYMLERGYSFELIVVVTTMVMLAVVTALALGMAGSPDALLATLHHALNEGMERGRSLYKVFGIESGVPAETEATIVQWTVRLAPALVAMSSALMVLVNLSLFWRWVGKHRLTYQLFGDLAKWSTPEWLIWVFLATGFALFVPVKALDTIALDAFVCVAAVYFCQGLAIMSFYFKMLAMPSVARAVIYLIAGIQPVLAALVCAVGVFDLWVDFRRLKPPSQEADNFGDFF